MKQHALFLKVLALAVISPTAFATDDCQFIRDRLAAANPGELIEIPAGAYVCAAPIVLDKNGVTLAGATDAGHALVTLRLADHANAPLVIIGRTETPPAIVRGIAVRDLILDGNMDNQDMECWGGPCDSGGTAYIRNNGITIRGAHECSVENVRAHHARSGGMVTERDVRALVVRGFEAHDNFFDGLAGYVTESSVFSDLHLHGNRYAGISIDIEFNRNIIEDALIEKNGDVGIFARWSAGNRFERVAIVDNGSHGIFLAHDGDPARCPFDYIFRSVDVVGSMGWGLWLNNEVCTGTKIENSRFTANRDGCVRVPIGGEVGMTDVACG